MVTVAWRSECRLSEHARTRSAVPTARRGCRSIGRRKDALAQMASALSHQHDRPLLRPAVAVLITARIAAAVLRLIGGEIPVVPAMAVIGLPVRVAVLEVFPRVAAAIALTGCHAVAVAGVERHVGGAPASGRVGVCRERRTSDLRTSVDLAVLVSRTVVRAVISGFVALTIALLILALVAHEGLVPVRRVGVDLRIRVVAHAVFAIEPGTIGAVAIGVLVAVLSRIERPAELHALRADPYLDLFAGREAAGRADYHRQSDAA